MHRWSWIAVFSLLLTPACGGDDGSTSGNGGSGGDGGSAGDGGSSAGGSGGDGGSAGSSVGGDGGSGADGGTSSGGSSSGGTANGGSSGMGGSATGGSGTGGSATGGTSTGGSATGGSSTGGSATGGSGTGGSATGGTGGMAGTGGSAGSSGSGGSGGSNPGTSCTAGARRCNGSGVEVCNSSGSAWLHVESCAQSCSAGLCTGACTPNTLRCNANQVQQCNSGGSGYTTIETCSSFCDVPSATCAVAALEITGNEDFDGTLVVDGALVVRSGATLNSPSGDLTIIADQIVVENGGTIAVAPTGSESAGAGGVGAYSDSCSYRYPGGGGGGYGSNGATSYSSNSTCGGRLGAAHGQSQDGFVTAGSRGGAGTNNPGSGGYGGGVLRLVAPTITIAGTLSATGQNGAPASSSNWGGGGGGSGGGILIAADNLTVSGSVNVSGGTGGAKSSSTYSYAGGNGGNGRVKRLYGVTNTISGSTSGATLTTGILPPLTLTSASHPQPARIYNDDFPEAYVTWNRPFPSALGYYELTNTTATTVPSPSNANFLDTESITLPRSEFVAGTNYFHLASIDGNSAVSTVQSWFQIQVNTTPPSMASSSHPSQTTWSGNATAFYSWTFPVADSNLVGAYWVRDVYADTVPTSADNFLPVANKQLIQSNLPDGIHFFHVVSVDTQGYLTKQAGHYQVRIGADPGAGVLLGQVVDDQSQPVSGASVQINRGLASQTTNGTGNYNFNAAIAGTGWEVRVRKAGYQDAVATVNVSDGGSTTRNFVLVPLP